MLVVVSICAVSEVFFFFLYYSTGLHNLSYTDGICGATGFFILWFVLLFGLKIFLSSVTWFTQFRCADFCNFNLLLNQICFFEHPLSLNINISDATLWFNFLSLLFSLVHGQLDILWVIPSEAFYIALESSYTWFKAIPSVW